MLELKIKDEEGKSVIYQADKKIVEGLYLTFDAQKVEANAKALSIHLNKTAEGVQTVIKALKKVSVVTIVVNKNTKFQYFVGGDLDLKGLIKVPETEMPNNLKEVVLKAYHLIQKNTIVSKIKKFKN